MHGFFARFHRFRPSRPRHPLLRLLLAVLGIALLMLLVLGGVLVGLGMLAFRAMQSLLRRRAAAKPAGSVLEGEYRVVEARSLPQAR
ncbi:hypothetical protein [Silanimonas lenta]|jgi:predicted anti-sigma-YlaC factor YlaD|uniref:hypothetical protein n=1 Tax=Silanimonas lenta TaxID=265429 RepID=UPI000426D604|nr:hypothetical protein [Silanimonas lenta]